MSYLKMKRSMKAHPLRTDKYLQNYHKENKNKVRKYDM